MSGTEWNGAARVEGRRPRYSRRESGVVRTLTWDAANEQLMTENDETVRIKTTAGGTTVKCYHTRECDVWPENGRTVLRADAEKRGLSKCKRCSGLDMTGEDNDPRKYIRQIEEARAND